MTREGGGGRWRGWECTPTTAGGGERAAGSGKEEEREEGGGGEEAITTLGRSEEEEEGGGGWDSMAVVGAGAVGTTAAGVGTEGMAGGIGRIDSFISEEGEKRFFYFMICCGKKERTFWGGIQCGQAVGHWAVYTF